MTKPTGQTLTLSLPRRLVCDLIHVGKKIPAVTVQRKIQIGELVAARSKLETRPGWCTLFTKAFSLVAVKFPQFRRSFLSWPRPRLYEHSLSVASVAMERDFNGEPAVLFARLRAPEQQTLAALEGHIRRFKSEPIESLRSFRQAMKISRYPRFLRRSLWWIASSCSGRLRTKYLGTFGVSVYSSLGASSLNPISPLTATLNYDVIQKDGSVDVRVVYDHRVMDGGTVARALADLEKVLNTEILDELTGPFLEQMMATKNKETEVLHGPNELLV